MIDVSFDEFLAAAIPPGYLEAMMEAKKKYPHHIQFYQTEDGSFMPWNLRPGALQENIQREWNW